ncbi:MAG: universal stress protein [Planctomycetes bacterium]|nr:universal stress protein [Planctomycetota bacterium]
MDPIRTVLVAVDLSSRTDKVMAVAHRLVLDRHGARAILLHVVSDYEAALGTYGTGRVIEGLQKDLEAAARGRLSELAAQWEAADEVAIDVRSGPPWSEIVAAAMHHRADLIVMGAHFEDLPKHKVLGDSVTKVTRISPCPVVVVPVAED